MEALYTALDQGKIGIFESPTGTVSLRMRTVHLITISVQMTGRLSCLVFDPAGKVSESYMRGTDVAERP